SLPCRLREIFGSLTVIALASCVCSLAGCCRPWQTSAMDPPSSPPQEYGQRPYSDSYSPPTPNAYKSAPYSDPYAARPLSGQYPNTPPTDGYQPGSRSDPLGPVTRSNSYQH